MTEAPRKETAEEQLLRLIEGGQAAKPQTSAATVAASPKLPPQQRFAGWVRQASSGLLSRWRVLFQGRQRGDTVLRKLQLASRLVWVVLAGLGLYLVADVFRVQSNLSKPPTAAKPSSAQASTVTPPQSPDSMRKPMADYLAVLLERNPFTGVSGSTAAVPIKRARERLKELTADLVVVGIDRGPKPEALIEDKAQGRTYFVKVGDVVNGAFVKEISTRGVVVEYDGEEELLR